MARSEAPRAEPLTGLAPGEASKGLRPLVTLGAAVADDPQRLAAMFEHNALHRGPVQTGFVRSASDGTGATAFSFHGDSPSRDGGTWRLRQLANGVVWSARIRVEGAYALQVRLEGVFLPAGTQIWLISDAGERAVEPLVLGPYHRELLDAQGDLWLPAAPGPEVAVEVHVPRPRGAPSESARFAVTEIAELFDLRSPSYCTEMLLLADRIGDPRTASGSWDSCRIDATCVSSSQVAAIENLRKAVASIFFVKDGTTYGCSAALLADEAHSGTPYLLTAGHCFDTAEAAASVTAYFDFRTDACNGPAPNTFDLPKVAGSTLLATAQESDFTLVRLSGLPDTEVHFLGWTVQRPDSGTVLHSVTHPFGHPQSYAASTFVAPGEPNACGGALSHFHKSTALHGSTYFGSSGGPQVVDRNGGQVVGQIRGICFPDPDALDWCDGSTFSNLTGTFEYTHPLVAPWLGASWFPLIFKDGFETGNTAAWSAP